MLLRLFDLLLRLLATFWDGCAGRRGRGHLAPGKNWSHSRSSFLSSSRGQKESYMHLARCLCEPRSMWVWVSFTSICVEHQMLLLACDYSLTVLLFHSFLYSLLFFFTLCFLYFLFAVVQATFTAAPSLCRRSSKIQHSQCLSYDHSAPPESKAHNSPKHLQKG